MQNYVFWYLLTFSVLLMCSYSLTTSSITSVTSLSYNTALFWNPEVSLVVLCNKTLKDLSKILSKIALVLGFNNIYSKIKFIRKVFFVYLIVNCWLEKETVRLIFSAQFTTVAARGHLSHWQRLPGLWGIWVCI